MMKFEETLIRGAFIITPSPFSDNRGWFTRVYDKNEFAGIGHSEEWVQINHSYTRQPGMIRGMHFQNAPYAEIKAVRCIQGKVFDVMVDLRKDSPSFLQWAGYELTPENKKTVYIPTGVAHGFQVLQPDSELIYLHSAVYQQAYEGAIRFDDPLINIQWPLAVTDISEKDSGYPLLNKDFEGITV